MEALVITPEIEAAAQRLAEATGTTPTEALAEALRETLRDLPLPSSQPRKTAEEILALIRSHQLTVINDLSEDEILGYDSFGIPEQPHLGR